MFSDIGQIDFQVNICKGKLGTFICKAHISVFYDFIND